MEEIDRIAHVGVKGMKWGVRKRPPMSLGPQAITIDAKAGKKIVTTGGGNQPVSADAKLSAVYRQKGRASGHQSLSNEEMRVIVTRMGLEQQYLRLNPRQRTLGEKFLQDHAPAMALDLAKTKYGTSSDENVKMGLRVGEMLIKQTKTSK